jgi:flagellar basal body P-ring formation protein FlgA
MRVLLVVLALTVLSPAFAGIRVVVTSHDIARGAVLSESDLTYATAAGDATIGTVFALNDAVGLQTRRIMRAGESLRLEDLKHPVIVQKGSTVTMTFEAPGIVLTATGRAMSEAGMGESVTVQNPASFRQIMAVVTGPGQVRAQMSAARLAALQP